jgi:lysophospholipase L1-like esterase
MRDDAGVRIPVSRKVVALAGVALCLIGSACTPLHVTIFGDSITTRGEPQYHAVLDPTYTLVVDGVVGATIATRSADIDVIAAHPPEVFILNLGTNDAGEGSTTIVADWMAQMAKFLEADDQGGRDPLVRVALGSAHADSRFDRPGRG